MIPRATLNQFLSLCPVIIASFTHGLDNGWIAPAVDWLQSNQTAIAVTANDLSWISSVESIGIAIGLPFAAALVPKIGTKYSFIFQGLLLVIAWYIINETRCAAVLIASQFLEGVSMGVASLVGIFYFGEISSLENRSTFTTIASLCNQLGKNFELILNDFISFAALTWVSFVAAGILFVSSFFMIETPYQLLLKNRREEALKYISWLSGQCEEDSRTEMNELVRYIDEEKCVVGFWRFIRQPENYNAWLLGVITFTLGHFHSGTVIRIYGIVILKPFDDVMNGKMFISLLAFITLGASLMSPFFAKFISPRILLLVGFLLSCVFQFIFGCLFYVTNTLGLKSVYISYGVFASLGLFEVICVCAISTAVNILQTELFPQRVKSAGICVSKVLHSLLSFAAIQFFVAVWQNFELHWTFVSFAVVHLGALIYVYFVLPDTKGKSLMEIRRDFKIKYGNYGRIE